MSSDPTDIAVMYFTDNPMSPNYQSRDPLRRTLKACISAVPALRWSISPPPLGEVGRDLGKSTSPPRLGAVVGTPDGEHPDDAVVGIRVSSGVRTAQAIGYLRPQAEPEEMLGDTLDERTAELSHFASSLAASAMGEVDAWRTAAKAFSDEPEERVQAHMVRMTPSLIARMEAVGWKPGQMNMGVWLVEQAERAAELATYAAELRALLVPADPKHDAEGYDLQGQHWIRCMRRYKAIAKAGGAALGAWLEWMGSPEMMDGELFATATGETTPELLAALRDPARYGWMIDLRDSDG